MGRQQPLGRRDVLLGVACVVGLAGCATGNDLVRAGTLSVERTASAYADMSVPSVRQTPTGIAVRGEVAKPFANRGPIPGHIHLAVIDPAGQMLADTPVKLTRASVKARSARYHAELPVALAPGSLLRVTHHAGGHGHAVPCDDGYG